MVPALLTYPDIDPVIFTIYGPLAVRWYGLAYLAGMVLGIYWIVRLARFTPKAVTKEQALDYLFWAMIGIIAGGRLGELLFYHPDWLLDPLQAVAIWSGGMSFHGGFIGVIVATILFARKRKIDLLAFSDLIACASPIGLFFGRIANFINGELWGRVASPDLPWAMVFPGGGSEPRHPSQLYEAGLEGLVLFLILWGLWRVEAIRMKFGTLTGCFMIGYGLSRIAVEFFREPEVHQGFLAGGFVTMGMVLSLPMVLGGIGFILYANKRKTA